MFGALRQTGMALSCNLVWRIAPLLFGAFRQTCPALSRMLVWRVAAVVWGALGGSRLVAPSQQVDDAGDVEAVVEPGGDAGELFLQDSPLPELSARSLLLPAGEAGLGLPRGLGLVDPTVGVGALVMPVDELG
jgi:hypothetical protein